MAREAIPKFGGNITYSWPFHVLLDQRLARLRHVSGTTLCCGDSEEMTSTDWVRNLEDREATAEVN